MSLYELKLNTPKPWCDARINNLNVDATANMSVGNITNAEINDLFVTNIFTSTGSNDSMNTLTVNQSFVSSKCQFPSPDIILQTPNPTSDVALPGDYNMYRIQTRPFLTPQGGATVFKLTSTLITDNTRILFGPLAYSGTLITNGIPYINTLVQDGFINITVYNISTLNSLNGFLYFDIFLNKLAD